MQALALAAALLLAGCQSITQQCSGQAVCTLDSGMDRGGNSPIVSPSVGAAGGAGGAVTLPERFQAKKQP